MSEKTEWAIMTCLGSYVYIESDRYMIDDEHDLTLFNVDPDGEFEPPALATFVAGKWIYIKAVQEDGDEPD